MTEGPGIATTAYLLEQVADFAEPLAHRRSSRTPKYAGEEGVDAIVLWSGTSMRRTHLSTRRRPRPSLRAISPMELPPSKRALISLKICCRTAWRSDVSSVSERPHQNDDPSVPEAPAAPDCHRR